MKCVIPGTNVKILARAIHALAKIGEEMYVQPQERALSFRAVSMSNAAYCDFTFRDCYFSYYNYGNLDEEDALKCKVSMRGAMSVFKTPGIIDKLVETCHIKLEPNAPKLSIILKYKNSVIKTFLLPILNCETLQASYNKDSVPNHLVVQPKVLSDALHNFQQNLVEITLDALPDKILIRNYVNENSNISNSTRTQLAPAIGEFDTYKIGLNSCVTFCMKEVRAILAFSEIVALPIHVFFEVAGRPIVFVIKNPSYEANLVLSTLNPEPPDASNTSKNDRRQALKKRGTIKRTPKSTKARPKSSKISTASSEVSYTTSTRISDRIIFREDETPLLRESEQEVADTMPISHFRTTGGNTNDAMASSNSSFSGPRLHRNLRKDLEKAVIAETPSSNNSTPPPANVFSEQNSPASLSLFSSYAKRQAAENDKRKETDYEMDTDHPMEDDVVPNSPPRPAKRAKMLFKKCLQSTFDPNMLPGHDTMLAEDSDDELY